MALQGKGDELKILVTRISNLSGFLCFGKGGKQNLNWDGICENFNLAMFGPNYDFIPFPHPTFNNTLAFSGVPLLGSLQTPRKGSSISWGSLGGQNSPGMTPFPFLKHPSDGRKLSPGESCRVPSWVASSSESLNRVTSPAQTGKLHGKAAAESGPQVRPLAWAHQGGQLRMLLQVTCILLLCRGTVMTSQRSSACSCLVFFSQHGKNLYTQIQLHHVVSHELQIDETESHKWKRSIVSPWSTV